MTNPFAPKPKAAPPPEAPKRVKLDSPGAIRECIIGGKKLFAIKQLPNGYEFDYRIWISEYRETHVMALINGMSLQVGELIPSEDGYTKFVLATQGPESEELFIFAMNQFAQLWHGVDVACKVPSTLEFNYYD